MSEFPAIAAYVRGGIHAVPLPEKFIVINGRQLELPEPTEAEIEAHLDQVEQDVADHEVWLNSYDGDPAEFDDDGAECI